MIMRNVDNDLNDIRQTLINSGQYAQAKKELAKLLAESIISESTYEKLLKSKNRDKDLDSLQKQYGIGILGFDMYQRAKVKDMATNVEDLIASQTKLKGRYDDSNVVHAELTNQGIIFLKLELPEQALQCFQQILKFYPKDEPATGKTLSHSLINKVTCSAVA